MHIQSQEITFTGDQRFRIYPIGDVHIGTVHHDRNHWLRDIQRIADDPNAYWIGMGDFCECIVLSDPRFEASEIAPEFRDKIGTLAKSQFERFIADVEPIKHKCLGLLEGNHEFQLKRRHYIDVVLDACRELGVPMLTDTAMLRLIFRRVGEDGGRHKSHVLTIFAEHGNGGGRKTGGKINSLEDMMGPFDADIYLRGHVHQKLATKHPRISVPAYGEAKMVAKTRLCVLTGCYYKTYEAGSSSYGQRSGYNPTELGCVTINYFPRYGTLEVTT